MFSQSKPRRTKTPIASVRDKFEEVHKASQSEMSPTYIEIPQIEIPVEPTIIVESIPEPLPEVKSKKSNAWIIHVKSIAEGKGIKFRDALRDPETKATYKK